MVAVLLLAPQVPGLAQALQALTHWCAMHPDQRAASPVACPVCRMTMVPIPPMKVGEYRIDIAPMRAARGGGIDGLRLTLREPGKGPVVAALETIHEKPLHVFIVSDDFAYFRHVHAESIAGGVAEIRVVVPPGAYMLIADFVPAGGQPQRVHRALLSPGARPARASRPATNLAGGVRARALAADLEAGRSSTVRIALAGERDGRPIADLEPYLGAAAHLLLVNEGLTESVHAHATDWSPSDPLLSFDLSLPSAGAWHAFLQFQRAGTVITVPMSFVGR